LRQGIHLRGYAQKNPKQEYQREAFEMFGALLEHVRSEITRVIMTIRIRDAEEVAQAEAALEAEAAAALGDLTMQHASAYATDADADADAQNNQQNNHNAQGSPFTNIPANIGRNDACPCGSGSKFKNCHGKLN
jgi:preprotein translocase subunit SecA